MIQNELLSKAFNTISKLNAAIEADDSAQLESILKEPAIKTKIGYKGFDSNLCSKNIGGSKVTQYEIGKTYSKPRDVLKDLKLCSTDGFHYCDKLEHVYHHYEKNNHHRYCEVEILGDFKDGIDKSITTSLKILREITYEVNEKEILKNIKPILETIRKLQEYYPMFFVGGSIALFLYGARIRRWATKTFDIDLITPYFVLPTDKPGLVCDKDDESFSESKFSGNDFDKTFFINNTKVDYKVDPTQEYIMINYDGFDYKVSHLSTILAAKAKYSLLPNGKKHTKDLKELVCYSKPKPYISQEELAEDDTIFLQLKK